MIKHKCKIAIFAISLLIGMLPFSSLAQQNNKQANYLINEFPTSVFFRVPQNYMNDGYAAWEKEFERVNGIITKSVKEEISSGKMDLTQKYLRKFKAAHPGQLVMLHLNGRSRDPYDNHGQYFAGHWLYLPGCQLTRDVTPEDTVLYIQDPQFFKTAIQKTGRPVTNDHICLVPLNHRGEKDWYGAEQIILKSINYQQKYLVVQRGQFGSHAHSFSKGMAYLAPHAHKGPFGEHILWEYNMSETCPIDSLGQTASDVFISEIAEWTGSTGVLSFIDGIAFDVTDFEHYGLCKGRHVDVNNDGNGDDGLVNNINVHGKGILRFFEDLRQRKGNEFIITADGHNEVSQRALGVLNGMETEGLCTHNDPYRAWSKTINYIDYWNKNTKGLPVLNYVAVKNVEEQPLFPSWSNERFAMGTAVCLNAVYTEGLKSFKGKTFKYAVKDETVGGKMNKKQWLGKPLDDMQFYFKNEQGYSIINLIQEQQSNRLTLINCELEQKDGIVILKRLDKEKTMSLVLTDLSLPAADLFMSFDAKADASVSGFPMTIPHKLYAEVIAKDESPHNARYLYGLFGVFDYASPCFYYRNDKSQTVDVKLVFETANEVAICNFMIRNATPVIFRLFENGVVVVNPSVHAVDLNISELFPSTGLMRLMATPWQKTMDPYQYNTGKEVEGSLTIQPVDAIFLKKKECER